MEYLPDFRGKEPVETTTGALDWGEYSYEDLQEYIEENYPGEYDGFILDEGGETDFFGNIVHRGLSYIPFRPSQIKSADAVTYDDKRIITQYRGAGNSCYSHCHTEWFVCKDKQSERNI